MTWHVDPETLDRYGSGTVGPVSAASVEAHLLTCAACRDAVAPHADPDRLARTWARIEAAVDRPEPSWAGRTLDRLGVHDHVARPLMTTPLHRGGWLTAVLVAVGLASVLAATDTGGATLLVFLVSAPLVPLGVVAVTFDARRDPVGELAATLPGAGLPLLLTRTVAVLVPSLVVLAGLARLLPHHGWDTMAWLAPALALSCGALALATAVPVERAAAGLGTAWVLGASAAAGLGPGQQPGSSIAFRPIGQAALLVVAAAAAVVVARRRAAFDGRSEA